MSKARQFFSDAAKSIKVYPWTLAKLVKVLGGGTVQDYMDGTKKVSKSVDADNVSWGGVSGKPSTYPPSSHTHNYANLNHTHSNYTEKLVTGLSMYAPSSNNAKGVDTSGNHNGQIETANNHSGPTTNLPVSNFIGIKVQYAMSAGWCEVLLYEMHPVAGRIWMAVYNYGWSDWILIAGRVDLWSGSAIADSTITLPLAKTTFRSLDIFFNAGERISCPLTDGNEDVWGTITTTAGTQLYTKSVHLQFTNAKALKVVSCLEKAWAEGTTSNKNIVKIVGRP